MQNDTIHFSDALNQTLGNPTRIKTDIVSPETFKNFVVAGGASRAGKTSIVNKAIEEAGVNKTIATVDFKDLGVDMQDVEKVVNQFKNPTREAMNEALEALNRLNEQAIVSNTQALKIQREMKRKTNPNHYGTKSTKRAQRLHKPAKFFGDSKKVIYVRDKNGEPKPISMKNAKKKGLI